MKQSRFLGLFAALVYAILHVPLQLLCAVSFNISKWRAFKHFISS